MSTQPELHGARLMFYGRDGIAMIYVHIEPDSLKVTPLDDGTTEITWRDGHPEGGPHVCCDLVHPEPNKIILPQGLAFTLTERLPAEPKAAAQYCQAITRAGYRCTLTTLPMKAYCKKHIHQHGPLDLERTSAGLKPAT